MTRPLTKKTAQLSLALAIAGVCNGAYANPITGAIGETKPIIDIRARYEWVEQDPPPAVLTYDANALTIRGRLGAETGKAWNTSLLAEGEFLTTPHDAYRADPAVAVTNASYPVVADPEAYELNRLQLTNTSINNTTITLGRQRIVLDDQRFVGNVAWRMNEQTYDALRVVTRPNAGNLFIDLTYLDRVNRIYGPDSPQGAYKGDAYLVNVAYQFLLGKLTAFDYALDFDPKTTWGTNPTASETGLNTTQKAALNPARSSSQTIGARFAGTYAISKIKLAYAASWANQKDYGSYTTTGRPSFSNDYTAAEIIGTYRQYSLGVGFENMDGDGTQGFQTPLATLHKFDGWADKFLSTPAKGLENKYLTGSFTTKGVAPFETVSLTAYYRKFNSTMGSQDYGNETDVMLTAKYSRVTGMLKFATYHIYAPVQLIANNGTVNNAFSTLNDTKKFWAELDFVW